MTRLFRRTTPRLATWTPRAESERPFSVVDQDRDEARSAARDDASSYKRVGGALMDVYDVPSEGDLMDTARRGDGDWGES